MALPFDEAVAELGLLKRRGWRLGLDRMQALCERLGLADYLWGEDRPLFIHVAGTNGKGTVTHMAEHLLRQRGRKTGATFSPYVVHVTERIQVDGSPVSEEEFARVATLALEAGRTLEDTDYGGPTEFELKTAMAFLAWRDAGVDAAAVEVGLGGRLDATNVIQPAVAVITSIGLDHQEFLGETLAEIAGEKAGIIKPGAPTVIGAMPEEASDEIRRKGGEIHAFDGPRMESNAWCAAQAVSLALGEEIDPGFARAVPPTLGRMQALHWQGREVVVDGAHNPAAMAYLAAHLDKAGTLIFGALRGHDASASLAEIRAKVARIILVPIQDPRAMTMPELVEIAGQDAIVSTSTAHALELALQHKEPILATGSFYLVGEVLRAIQSGSCSQ